LTPSTDIPSEEIAMSDLIPDSEDERTAADTDEGPITRQALYELVWAEPMLKVAARFGVS
jgi:hypothetical protein